MVYYDRGLQTNQVLALALMGQSDSDDSDDSDDSAAVLAALLEELQRRGTHQSTGILGTKHLFDVLIDGGRADQAVALLAAVDYPSYGFMAFNHLEPATDNVWELFSAPCEGNGMNSRNHHSKAAAHLHPPSARMKLIDRSIHPF